MNNKFVKAIDVANELGLYLKVVTSMKYFDTYNSFFNIFGEVEEPCRRIVVLTPYKELEEVIDEKPAEPIIKGKILDGNLWLEEYPLLVSIEKIKLEEIMIDEYVLERLKAEVNYMK